MILSSISRKYAAYLLLLLSLVVGAALAAAGYITLQGTTRLQRDLQHFIAADESARQKEALRATAVYLRSHLFNPLYNLDIEQLHREIAQVRAWLPVSAFLISDRAGRVLSDGAPDNRLYGATLTLPLAELAQEPTVIRPASGGLELFFAISYDPVIAGYAYVKLNNSVLDAVLQRLDTVSDQLWRDYWQALTRLALIAALAIVIVGSLLGLLLSRVLARPLVEMSKAAQAYAAGQLEQQLPVSSPDELGQLAQALNTLATDLRDSQIRLAQAQHHCPTGFLGLAAELPPITLVGRGLPPVWNATGSIRADG
ncbi:MAG: HAMP domain-containing protein [Synechococcaceae cyanobacterium SM1_2_3]|nr:HAMP domain-containing protein [Synechococcaceae cyanobacterium SM1_2_3]